MKKTILVTVCVILALGWLAGIAAGAEKKTEYVIKIGTVVPEMGAMSEMLQAFKKEIAERTGGRLKIIIYFGGVMGDEMDIVRKMRIGQLQGGGMTLLGLGQMCPSSKVLELPFLFNNFDEIDYVVHNKMRSAFAKEFEKKGAYLVGWYDTGFGYFFFQEPVNSFEDIQKMKMVSFTGDPLFAESERAIGFENLIPLHISETLTGLRTGLINGTFSPFFALVGLQWNSHVSYVLDHPISYSVAGLVINRKDVDKMPPDIREVLFDAMAKQEAPLIKDVRRMEKETYENLLKRGIEKIPPKVADQIVAEMKKRAEPLYEKFIDEYYPSWLLSGIRSALSQYRTEKGTAKR